MTVMTALHPAPVVALTPDPIPGVDLPWALEYAEAAFWRAVYRAAPDAGFRTVPVGSGCAFVAPGMDVLALNKVLGLGLEEALTADSLDEVLETYRAAGVPRAMVQLPPDVADAEHDLLATRGFRYHNRWMKLYRRLDGPLPAAETALTVEPLGVAHAGHFGRLVAPAFDWPRALEPALAATVGRRGWSHYLACDGPRAVASAALHVHEGVGYLGPAVTLPGWRGRGAQSALIARRLRDAASAGCRLAVVDTAEPTAERPSASYRNLRRLGFAAWRLAADPAGGAWVIDRVGRRLARTEGHLWPDLPFAQFHPEVFP